MRNKLAYSCSIKIHQNSMNSWKIFFASCWLWKHFPRKNGPDASRSGSKLVRGQVSMVDSKTLWPRSLSFWSVGCTECSWVVVGMNWAVSVDQGRLQALQFLAHLINLLSILLICDAFAGVQKSCGGLDWQQTTRQWPGPFWCEFGFGKCFGAAAQSSR